MGNQKVREKVMRKASDQALGALKDDIKAAMSFKATSKIMNELNTYYENPASAFATALKSGELDNYDEPELDQIFAVCKELSVLWGDERCVELLTIIRNMLCEVSLDRLIFEFYLFMKKKEKELESDKTDSYYKVFGNVGFKQVEVATGNSDDDSEAPTC